MEYRDLKKQLKSEEQTADIQKLLHLRHREKMVRMGKLIKEQKERRGKEFGEGDIFTRGE